MSVDRAPGRLSSPASDTLEGRIRVTAPTSASTVRVDRVAVIAGALGTRLTAALGSVLSERLIDTAIICVLCSLERDGSLRPREIQALTMLTSGGTTNLLDRLARRGLVSRSHDTVAGDRRAVVVELTSHGHSTVAGIVEVFAAETPAIRPFLAELDAELAGGGFAGDADDRSPAGAVEPAPDALLDAIIGLSQLGFALHRAMVAGLEPETYMDNAVCIVLGSLLSGGPRRPLDLQPRLGLSSGAMTKLLIRIERSGLVTRDRRRLEADRRATIVSITPAGRRAMAEAGASMTANAAELRGIIRDVDTALARGATARSPEASSADGWAS